MDFRGTYEHGMIRPDTPVDLPDGTRVDCHAIPSPDQGSTKQRFFQNRTVEEMTREQGVKPLQSIKDLAIDWPDDDPADSVDEFLRHVREWRR